MTAVDDALAQARDGLRAAKRALAAEISAYPIPIAGCDAQYNHLLDRRQAVNRALALLDPPSEEK